MLPARLIPTVFDRFAACALLLFLLVVSGLGGLLLAAEQRQNQRDVRAEQQLVAALLDESRRQLSTALTDYAIWDDMYRRVGIAPQVDLAWFKRNTTESVYSRLNIDLLLLVDAVGQVQAVLQDGQWRPGNEVVLDMAWRQLLHDAMQAAPGSVLERDLPRQGVTYWLAAQRVQSEDEAAPASQRLLMFGRRLDQRRLSQTLAAQQLPALHLQASRPVDEPAVRISQHPAERTPWLVWRAVRSGSDFVAVVLPGLVALVLVALLLAVLLWRITRRRELLLVQMNQRQAAQRKALVGLLDAVYAHERSAGLDVKQSAFWPYFVGCLQQTLAVTRLRLVLYGGAAGHDDCLFDSAGSAASPPSCLALAYRGALSESHFLAATGKLPLPTDVSAVAAVMRDGRLIGELALYRPGPAHWQADETNFVVGAAALATFVLESTRRRSIEQTLHRQFHFDPLTGLMSPLSLMIEMETRRELWSGLVVVAVVRLVDLQEINLHYGRETGDKLLQTLAHALAGLLHEGELAARGSGKRIDLLLQAASADKAQARLEQVAAALAEAGWLDQHGHRSEFHIGAVLCQPAELSAQRLHEATLALAEAGVSRNIVHWYGDALRQSSQRRLALSGALREAVDNHAGLSLAYQPFVRSAGGVPQGAEVLLRWCHPSLGNISPAEFIPLAESLDLIDELSLWVVDTAFAQLARWQQAGLPLQSLAINLSPHQLLDPALAARIVALLHQHQLGPGLIEFEVTESLALESSPVIRSNLEALQLAGMSIAIDDFGTGYATFSYLSRYRVDKIKLDKQFVDDLPNPAAILLLRSLINLGKGLGALITAEGIEQAEQWRQLSELGCDYLQGYYFAKPMPAEEFARWIATHAQPA